MKMIPAHGGINPVASNPVQRNFVQALVDANSGLLVEVDL